jgi:hypothetical protein
MGAMPNPHPPARITGLFTTLVWGATALWALWQLAAMALWPEAADPAAVCARILGAYVLARALVEVARDPLRFWGRD